MTRLLITLFGFVLKVWGFVTIVIVMSYNLPIGISLLCIVLGETLLGTDK